jgi:glycine cleavage system aminomethyltransferase T
VNLDFLSTRAGAADGGSAAPIARSPMEHSARAAGAVFGVRDGWNVAVSYGGGSEHEAEACRRTVGWADVSPLGKLELHGPPAQLEAIAAQCGATLTLGEAVRVGDAWWCRLTAGRALAICEPAALPALRGQLLKAAAAAERASLVDVTTNFAAMVIAGPLAREVFARFSALDLRPSRTPVGALRPGSIGRQPGLLICVARERYLFTFGWATGEYVWSIVADAALHLGGRPIGADALAVLTEADRDRDAEESVSA